MAVRLSEFPAPARAAVQDPASGLASAGVQARTFWLLDRACRDGFSRRHAVDIQCACACLKYWMARSCCSASARVRNVPRFRRLPVLGSTFREYNRYSPDLSFLIMATPLAASFGSRLSTFKVAI